MEIIKEIKQRLKGWKKLKKKEIPKWISKVEGDYYSKCGVRPYNKRKHFVGKNFIYRVQYGMGEQGECPLVGIYKKRKN